MATWLHHFAGRVEELERMRAVVQEAQQYLSRAKKLAPEEKGRLQVELRGNKLRLSEMEGVVDAESGRLIQRTSFTISDEVGMKAVIYLTKTYKWHGSVSVVNAKNGVEKSILKALRQRGIHVKRNR